MLDAEAIIDALLAEVGAGGVFHIDAVSIICVKCSDDTVVRRKQIPHTVPGIVKPRVGEPSQDGTDDVISQKLGAQLGLRFYKTILTPIQEINSNPSINHSQIDIVVL